MATDAQLTANRTNSVASTGPATHQGKAAASRNAVSHGLFSKGDFVHPEEVADYAQFCDEFRADLVPLGAVEQTFVAEIIHAAWRLRRCSAIETEGGSTYDPMQSAILDQLEASIERARTQATRSLHRNLAELRRLQTDRRFQSETRRGDSAPLGLVSFKDMTSALLTEAKRKQLLEAQRQHRKSANSDFAKRSQSDGREPAGIPRGAPCSCGSGIKYKRCCGKNAPPVLAAAA